MRITARLAVAALLLAIAPAHAQNAVSQRINGDSRFVVETNPFVLGQAMDWLDDQHVVWHDPARRDGDGDGQVQVYRSTLDGHERACLTCGLPGPNQVAVVQPKGRWILFHSWNGHALKVGSPGFGGLGSDVWVMTRDGKRHTNLTRSSEFHDNFHAYWSPDGRYIVWTALNWNADEGGKGRSDVREITLRWNRGRTRFKGGAVRRLTHSGDDGWVIPEFTWDPSGTRLLWTQNKFGAGRRVDQGCLARKIRAGIVAQLQGVDTIGQIPFSLVGQIREQAVALLRDPRAYPYQGAGCGGDDPNDQSSFEQETRIGHYEE